MGNQVYLFIYSFIHLAIYLFISHFIPCTLCPMHGLPRQSFCKNKKKQFQKDIESPPVQKKRAYNAAKDTYIHRVSTTVVIFNIQNLPQGAKKANIVYVDCSKGY